MAEDSDALLDWLDRVMKGEFDAKMLGRVGRGQQMCFSWSEGTRYVTVLLGYTDTRTVTKTRTGGTEATGEGARDALEPLDTFQAPTFHSAVGLSGTLFSSGEAEL